MSSFTIEGRELAKALTPIVAVLEKRNTIPILSNVRLTTAGGVLTLSGTDLDIVAVTTADLILGEPLDITVNGDLLFQIAKQAGRSLVRLEVAEREEVVYDRGKEDKKTRISTVAAIDVADGDASYELQTLPASDFPEMFDSWKTSATDEKKGKEFVETAAFTSGRLVDLFKTVGETISTEETRYYLNGIYHEPGIFTSTDGHRLTSYSYDKEEAGSMKGKAWKGIIPRRVCFLLTKFAKTDCKLFMSRDEMWGRAELPGLRLHYKMIDGTYPDYRRVIPKAGSSNYTFEFQAYNIRTAIDRVLPISTERGRAVKLSPDAMGRTILSVKNADYGTAQARTFADWPEMADVVGFNARYLLAMLPKRGTFRLGAADAGSPHLIEHGDEPDVIRVLMPMRV